MTNTELRINGVLMDTAADIAVRLNRQLINPGELNTKDAQYSFSISLPATATNHRAFNYAHVEETKNKFNREYNAELVINSVRVFNGKFRLSNIDKNGYKGNLYIPAQKSIKDIFGEIKLNQNPEYRIPFADFVASVNQYNNSAASGPQMAIFPYAMYGVLPKIPLNKNANTYSPRNVWDNSVRMGMQDLAPSINPLLMLKHIFNAQGYTLIGDAFDDVKLASLYMSYKNQDTYVQPWNYGQQAKIRLNGQWSTRYNQRAGNERFERGVNQGSDMTGTVYSTDFLNATNTKLTITEDTGGNVLYKEVNDADGVPWVNGQIRIPTAGFYKVEFNASLQVYDWNKWRYTDPATGVQHLGGRSQHHNNTFWDNNYEIRLCRDRGSANFGLSSPKLNNTFFYDNLPQNQTFNDESIPKYFPQVNANGQINFIDLAQDQYHLLGFAFGWRNNYATDEQRVQYRNPRDTTGYVAAINAGKPSTSWLASQNSIAPTRLAINSPGYWKYGIIGVFGDDDDNPNANIDYSGWSTVSDKHFDANGNPADPATPGADDGNVILQRFLIDQYFEYTIDAEDTGYTGNAYLHRIGETVPLLIIPFVAGVARFDTTPYTGPLVLSFYTKIGTTYTGDPKLSKDVNDDDDTVVGWEVTDKYAINLMNAPDNFARRGQFNGVGGQDANWFAQGVASCVVWLEAGELLTIGSVSAEGRYRNNGMHTTHGWASHYVNFSLSVQPFRIDPDWLKVSLSGNGTGAMNWNDPVNFDTDSINLVGFLSADIKTDDFIDNFCKAFNLNLSQIDANTFSLDVKQSKTAVSNQYIDLDGQASVRDRANTPLGLPSLYKIGFTVDVDEQGYQESGDDGGGQFETGVTDGDVVEQKSFFSYNWYKTIQKQQDSGNVNIRLPLISKSDIWASSMSYPESMKKKYTDLAYRFWYYGGLLSDLGADFDFNGRTIEIARVREDLPNRSILTYKNQQYTILDNYFTLLINGASHYTEVEAYLTPMQYQTLNGAVLARFNGDMYYVAELSGYDPSGRNKTKIKLIRKI